MTDTSYCWVHYVHEPIPPDVYRICFECRHVYPTAQSLVDRYNEEYARVVDDEMPPVTERRPPLRVDQVEEIYFCQECIHDF